MGAFARGRWCAHQDTNACVLGLATEAEEGDDGKQQESSLFDAIHSVLDRAHYALACAVPPGLTGIRRGLSSSDRAFPTDILRAI